MFSKGFFVLNTNLGSNVVYRVTFSSDVFGHFWVNVVTKPRVLESSKMSQMESYNFLFRPQ